MHLLRLSQNFDFPFFKSGPFGHLHIYRKRKIQSFEMPRFWFIANTWIFNRMVHMRFSTKRYVCCWWLNLREIVIYRCSIFRRILFKAENGYQGAKQLKIYFNLKFWTFMGFKRAPGFGSKTVSYKIGLKRLIVKWKKPKNSNGSELHSLFLNHHSVNWCDTMRSMCLILLNRITKSYS